MFTIFFVMPLAQMFLIFCGPGKLALSVGRHGLTLNANEKTMPRQGWPETCSSKDEMHKQGITVRGLVLNDVKDVLLSRVSFKDVHSIHPFKWLPGLWGEPVGRHTSGIVQQMLA